MAEEKQHKGNEYDNTAEVEVKDRGVLDFLGKKKEEEAIVTEFDNKVKVSDEPETKLQVEHEPEEKKHTLLEKLHRSNSSSSSSSDEEEEGEGGEKKKKKKKDKIGGGGRKEEDTTVPIERVEVEADSEDKKGFLDKIKEKLPGQQKKQEEEVPVPPTSSEYDAPHAEAHEGEKKGLLDKIKEKLPGYHPKTNEDKEKEIGSHWASEYCVL